MWFYCTELENTRDSVDGGEDKINDGGTGQDYYLLACKRLGLIPTEKFWKSLPGKAINLSVTTLAYVEWNYYVYILLLFTDKNYWNILVFT